MTAGEPCTKNAAFEAGLRAMRAWAAIGVESHRRFYVLRHGGGGGAWAVISSKAVESLAIREFQRELERAQRGAVAVFGRGKVDPFAYVTKR